MEKLGEGVGADFLDFLLTRVCRADVIKIEHPTRGDDTRSWGPPNAPYIDGVERQFPGESAYYLSVSLISHTHSVLLAKFLLY